MEGQVKIVLVDDHSLVAEAWSVLLSLESNFIVLGVANTADEAINICLKVNPDIVLMDINLKDSNGIDATEMICNRLPKTKVIGLSLHDDISVVKNIMNRGAKGYLSKNTNKEELIEAVNKVMSGEIYLGGNIRNKFFNDILIPKDENTTQQKDLTVKEIEIVKHIANGLTSKQIAEQSFISVRTVETHRHNILKKLGLQNAAQLSSWAREHGYF